MSEQESTGSRKALVEAGVRPSMLIAPRPTLRERLGIIPGLVLVVWLAVLSVLAVVLLSSPAPEEEATAPTKRFKKKDDGTYVLVTPSQVISRPHQIGAQQQAQD